MLKNWAAKNQAPLAKCIFYFFKLLGTACITYDRPRSSGNNNKLCNNGRYAARKSRLGSVFNLAALCLTLPVNYQAMSYMLRKTYNDDATISPFEKVFNTGSDVCATASAGLVLLIFALDQSRDVAIVEKLASILSRFQNRLPCLRLGKLVLLSGLVDLAWLLGTINHVSARPWLSLTMYYSNFVLHATLLRYTVGLVLVQHLYELVNARLDATIDSSRIWSTTTTTAAAAVDVRLARLLHSRCTEAVRDLAAFFSLPMTVCLPNVLMSALLAGYWITKPTQPNNDNRIGGFAYALPFVFHIILLAWSATGTVTESKRTSGIVNEISLQLVSKDPAIITELNLFSMHLLHADARIGVYGLFTIDESLLVSVSPSLCDISVIGTS
uniref:Gustatory receptor n=1 Tax=Trichogramma kaykai TaxID=54128 RepID=A0ABD2XAB3_9HYME